MKQIITNLLLVTVLTSCSKDDITNNEALITNIKIDLLGSYNGINENKIGFYFEYDNKSRLIKKIGGFSSTPTTSGYTGFYSNEIYTSLLYSGNNVTVEKFSSSPEFSVPKNTNYYTLNNSNQIIERKIPNTNNYLDEKHVYQYSNNKLVEIITTFPNYPLNPNDPNQYTISFSEKFYYDSDENLSRTEYYLQHDGVDFEKKVERIFESYDTSVNPIKRLYLLNDYFYRSISKNNYRKYSEFRYTNNTISSFTEINWTFNYDSKGNLILN